MVNRIFNFFTLFMITQASQASYFINNTSTLQPDFSEADVNELLSTNLGIFALGFAAGGVLKTLIRAFRVIR